ncbi:DUF1775 domain-containing protein [Curtobacterium flaccumfaciens]|nr:DUF1775 domain-containing protein [Curtobacterium flaccumfaciens]
MRACYGDPDFSTTCRTTRAEPPRKEPHAEASRRRRRCHPRRRSRHRPRQCHGGQRARVRDGHVDRRGLVHHGDLLGPARLRRLPHHEDRVPGAGVRHRGHAHREPELEDHEGDRAPTPTRRPRLRPPTRTTPRRPPSVTSVTYTAKTPLPADERDTFALSFSLPDGKAGDLVEFPAIQTCEKGSVEWNQEQQAGEAEPEHPAPSITLTAAEPTDDDGDPIAATPTTEAASTTASSDPDLVGRFPRPRRPGARRRRPGRRRRRHASSELHQVTQRGPRRSRQRSSARRLVAGTTAAVAITGGAVLGLAGPASAHNYLISSDPEVRGTLTELPEDFDITTNDKLLDIGGSGSGFAFRIVGPDGRYYEDGCVDVEGPSMTTAAALGDSGKYTVEWQIVSADGHTVSDEYPFTWKAPSGFTPASGAAKPPDLRHRG